MNFAVLLGLLPKALGVIASQFHGKTADAIVEAASAIDGRKGDPELQKALASLDLEALKLDAQVVAEGELTDRAMIESEDLFTKRARPMATYAAIAFTGAIVVATILCVHMDTALVISLLAPLWGHAGFYAHLRTKEKTA